MTAPQFPPRVFVDERSIRLTRSNENRAITAYGVHLFEEQIEYVSLSEHESLLREAVAKAWEEAGSMAFDFDCGDDGIASVRLSNMFHEKARETRNET